MTQNKAELAQEDCTLPKADATFFVPDHFTAQVLFSPDGGYYYRDNNHGCHYWIADITLSTESNRWIVKEQPTGPGQVVIGFTAYDLPSSSGFGGLNPILQWDCAHNYYFVRFYKKAAWTPEFKLVKWGSTVGKWNGMSCDQIWELGTVGKPGEDAYGTVGSMELGRPTDPPKPPGGVDTYRVAVIGILRGSSQQVAVHVDQVPPK